MSGETKLLPNRSTNRPPLALARYGSLDVPLTVWSVAGPADLIGGLATELAPIAPVVAVDLPGWRALPLAGLDTTAYFRGKAAVARAMQRVPAAAEHLARTEAVTPIGLASKLGTRHWNVGMVCASAWLLRCPGALGAAAASLAPGGFLVIVGRTEKDAVEIATLSDTTGWSYPLAFTAYLVAAAPSTFDAAIAALEGPGTTETAPTPAHHWGVGVWRRTEGLGGGTHA